MEVESSARPNRPPVITWYIVYCVAEGLTYLLMALVGLFAMVIPGFLNAAVDEWIVFGLMGGIYFVIGLVFFIPYAIAPFLPPKPWVWIYGLVLICIGMTSCFLPAAIALLIYWIKPDVQRYFGRQP